jgi:hypothetical protein
MSTKTCVGAVCGILFGTIPMLAVAGSPLAYRGELLDRGMPANGQYDLQLVAHADAALDTPLAAALILENVAVTQGRFQVELDFGLSPSVDQPIWIALAVRDGDDPGAFSAIPDRHKAMAPTLIGQCWSSTGDAGSNPLVNFLGTTDAQPFEIRTQNSRHLRIEPSAQQFNGAPITANVIAGSSENQTDPGVRGATIAGGGVPFGASEPDFDGETPNLVLDHYGSIGGGYGNQAGDGDADLTNGAFATIAGGKNNQASAQSSTIGGGFLNIAGGSASVVAGGVSNRAFGSSAAVLGGDSNRAIGDNSSVGGGIGNTALGAFSSVSSGATNCSGAPQSWAGGLRVKVRPGAGSSEGSCAGVPGSGTAAGDEGTFAWADNSGAGRFISNGPQRYLVRASGGTVIQAQIGSEEQARSPRGFFNVVRGSSGIAQPTSPSATIMASFENDSDSFVSLLGPANVNRGILFGSPSSATQGGMIYIGASEVLQFFSGGSARMTLNGTGQLVLPTLGSAGSTSLCRNASNQIASCSSSARYKSDIQNLHLGLDAVAQLRPVSYRWKDSGVADVGFVAEEVAALDERLVTRNESGQIEGVKYDRLSAVLAGAVQELAARDSLRQADIDSLRKDLAELRELLQDRPAGRH